jgi:NAD(P)-dependent dehydrogenase (short-subunit alcohol dehydrogenase family)
MTSNRTAIITGAYGAIGKAIAEKIASKGYYTVLIGRDEKKLLSAKKEIVDKTGNQNVRFEVVDLSRKQRIIDLASGWTGPLNILINNAASSPRRRMETPEHIEIQFATNVLGYFWMTKQFIKFMQNQDDARIVNVASYWAGGLDLNDLEIKKRQYDNDTAYRQSKQANRMLTVAFAQKLTSFGITVNACHPGDVNSKLSNDLGFGGHETPEHGAATPVWVATDPPIKGVTGKYFENHQQTVCLFSSDIDAIDKLYKICEGY